MPYTSPTPAVMHPEHRAGPGPPRRIRRLAPCVAQLLSRSCSMVRNTRKGFTLIELLIVVVIIGILAAIAIPKFANTKEKAYVASMKSDLKNLVNAEEAYFADNNVYSNSMA